MSRMRKNHPIRKMIEVQHDYERAPVPIVGDAAMAHESYGLGRLIPVLILDERSRPDIKEIFRAHQHLGSGDVKSTWGQRPGQSDTVALWLEFERPVESRILIEFELAKYGGLVDQVIEAQLVYLQAGIPGDRLITTQDA